MHITLPAALERYIREKIESGLYTDASEVVRDALRFKLEDERTRETRLDALRHEIGLGVEEAERGAFAAYDIDAVLRDLDAEADRSSRQ